MSRKKSILEKLVNVIYAMNFILKNIFKVRPPYDAIIEYRDSFHQICNVNIWPMKSSCHIS